MIDMDGSIRHPLSQDRMSDRRSFGSNYHQGSQSKKMSIGIVLDPPVKTILENVREDVPMVPQADNVLPSKGNAKKDRVEAEEAITRIQTEDPTTEGSPWVSTRSIRQKVSISDAIYQSKKVSGLATSQGLVKKSGARKELAATHTVQFFANNTPVLQNGNVQQKKFDGVGYQRKGKIDRSRDEDFSYATAQEAAPVPQREVADEGTKQTGNEGNGTLREKLQEILGAVSSPNINDQSPQTLDMGAHHLQQESKKDEKAGPTFKFRQHSDPIETDSESPDLTTKRPVTRSSTRKKPQSKVPLKKINNPPRLNLKKNAISSIEARSERISGPAKGVSSVSKSKETDRKSAGVENNHIRCMELDNADEIQQAIDIREEVAPAKRTSSLDTKKLRFSYSSALKSSETSLKKNETVKTKNGVMENHSHHSPVMETTHQQENIHASSVLTKFNWKEDIPNSSSKIFADVTRQETVSRKEKVPAKKSSSLGTRTVSFNSCSANKSSETVKTKNRKSEKDFHLTNDIETRYEPGNFGASTVREKLNRGEDFVNSLPKILANQDYGLKRPTFDLKTPVKISSPRASSKIDMEKRDADISPVERAFSMHGIRTFKSFLASKGDYLDTDANKGSTSIAEESEGSPVRKPTSIVKDIHKERNASRSPNELMGSDSSEDASPIIGFRRTESLFPEIGTVEKPDFVFRPAKRFRIQEIAEVDVFSPTSPFLQGDEESDVFHGLPEQNEEDWLASAVTLLALALQRVKSKIDLVTRGRAAEMLMTASDKIHSVLQNAEYQIQTDLGSLVSLRKSKRKHLETRLQEQQEQLKVVYEKFRDEVNQNLQNCKRTLEELDADHLELKGTLERKRVYHRKLLQQAEEVLNTELDEAERRVASMQKGARETMLQLKYVIAECLRDGILS